MHAKTNRNNHDFQILHFLVGACHTADGAYALLCDLRDDRSDALKHAEAARLRQQAKIIRARRLIASSDEADGLDGAADLAEIEAHTETVTKNLAAARAELDFIEVCMARIQPYRQYAHLPDAEAHEACQREEWRLELEARAQNYLLTAGTIPADHFATMRQHPDFSSHIMPVIHHTKALMNDGRADVLLEISRPLAPLLLGYE
jgi:NAD(P)-dependent dehydrogenase (short-subunit alcohol dehydrogenase family)